MATGREDPPVNDGREVQGSDTVLSELSPDGKGKAILMCGAHPEKIITIFCGGVGPFTPGLGALCISARLDSARFRVSRKLC